MTGDLICTRCGHRNASDANFCSSCGAPLDIPADEATISFVIDQPSGEMPIQISGDDVPPGGLLVVRSGPNAGSKYAVDKDHLSVGRHPDSDIFLDDVTVSRRHVEVVRRGPDLVVTDAGSLNGTYLNRARIEEATLHNGDELQVGTFKLVYVAGVGFDS